MNNIDRRDRIDVVFIHRFDPNPPIEATMHAFDCIQPMDNLVKRQAEVEILPAQSQRMWA